MSMIGDIELALEKILRRKSNIGNNIWLLEFTDGSEYYAYPNYEAARKAAIDSMYDLFDDIGIEGWNKEFAKNYYEIKEDDIVSLVDEMVEAEREAIEEEIQDNMSQQGYEHDQETGDLGDEFNNEVEDRLKDMREEYEESLRRDAKDFLVNQLGFYSEEDFDKASFVTYDLDRLFNDSVDIDGIAHTLAAYDGEEITVNDYHIYRWN